MRLALSMAASGAMLAAMLGAGAISDAAGGEAWWAELPGAAPKEVFGPGGADAPPWGATSG